VSVFQEGINKARPLTRYRHYIENIGTEDLIWIEIYKSDHVADISLTQWLALTPADIVAQTLKVPLSFAQQLKKDKQILIQ
jgi:oxalate decarboxylase